MDTRSTRFAALLLFVLMVSVPGVWAQATSANLHAALLGTWSIKISGLEYQHDMLVVIKPAGEGKLIGSYPEAGGHQIPDSPISVNGNEIALTIPHRVGGVQFNGELSKDGKKISGNCEQGGETHSCSLTKQGSD